MSVVFETTVIFHVFSNIATHCFYPYVFYIGIQSHLSTSIY